jgi:hypothetical protein
VAQVRSTGFADSTLTPDEAGLTPDTTSVVVHTTDGSTYTLVIGKSNERNQSYTQLQGDPTIYLVPRGRWNTIFRGSATLRAPEPAKAEGS